LAFYVILNSLQFKHPAYAHEKEFRALILGDRSAIAASPLHDFKPRKGQWIEFLKRPVFPSMKQPGTLKHIRIGPAAPSELVQQVRDAVTTLGLPVGNIDKSTIPYTSFL
jgi:hypothetical protein